MRVPRPSPEDQLEFLARLQRLFSEGDFTATYKYALLISLADLAVELGNDDGAPLRLATRQIADEFIRLYWQQAAPYAQGASEQGVLIQNHGRQAAIVTAIERFRRQSGTPTLTVARTLPSYPGLRTAVAQVVADQPLKYLQNFGGQTDLFLYDRAPGAVVLKPGIAYCLRRFQPLIQQLARGHWVAHLKGNRLNLPIIGSTDDLEPFLFETPREALATIGAELRRLDRRCFYCGQEVDKADVDHFIPFSLYPRDLIHNFVLAHPACNRSKSDTLAARQHLTHWLEFVELNVDNLLEIGQKVGKGGSAESSLAVTRWGYESAYASGAHAWVRPKTFELVDRSYLGYFT